MFRIFITLRLDGGLRIWCIADIAAGLPFLSLRGGGSEVAEMGRFQR